MLQAGFYSHYKSHLNESQGKPERLFPFFDVFFTDAEFIV
jgi:hypothetical protein